MIKSNDCRAKAMRDDQGHLQDSGGKKRHPPYLQHCLIAQLANRFPDCVCVNVYV